MRSLVAVGSGERVGPTGRPIMIIAPLSDDGYCSLKSCHSREILNWHSRAVSQSCATSAAKNLLQRFGAIAPDDENEPHAPSGYDGEQVLDAHDDREAGPHRRARRARSR